MPFVDCLTSILDPSLPLTAGEWEEWGNPIESAEIYKLMKAYSPFDNVRSADYPTMFVTTGYNDPRVLLLGAGQVGTAASGSIDERQADLPEDRHRRRPPGTVRAVRRMEGAALEYAFVLDALGVEAG